MSNYWNEVPPQAILLYILMSEVSCIIEKLSSLRGCISKARIVKKNNEAYFFDVYINTNGSNDFFIAISNAINVNILSEKLQVDELASGETVKEEISIV